MWTRVIRAVTTINSFYFHIKEQTSFFLKEKHTSKNCFENTHEKKNEIN